MSTREIELSEMWARHSAQWRNAAQVCSQWQDASNVDKRLLEGKATKGWWETLERLQLTLLVTREYEHLVMAASILQGRPRVSFFAVPHPSGLVVDRKHRLVYLASTRNPNQVYVLKPVTSLLERKDVTVRIPRGCFLSVTSSAFYPGSLYIHDLAVIGSKLYANAVGHNAIAVLERDGTFNRIWWPRCIEKNGQPVFTRNYIQLNSIASGNTLRDSFFSASSSSIGRYRPGHLKYPVDKRGVIFNGHTREPICTGLTRPHSARLSDKKVWVANSGYGEFGFVSDGQLQVVARLPGWTRGLCIVEDVAFVATSRVIPRYARYAPGLDVASSSCAVHAVCCKSGKILGRWEWPYGNQVFAIDWTRSDESAGFPFEVRPRKRSQETEFFYTYLTD